MQKLLTTVLLLVTIASCKEPPASEATSQAKRIGERYETEVLEHPSWSADAALYYLNFRHFTAVGNIVEAADSLKMLSNMGVGGIIVSPPYQIGKRNRRGTLGDERAIRNHREVDEALGDRVSFEQFVRRSHSLGMKVMLEWPLAYVAVDHGWTDTLSRVLMTDSSGKVIPVRKDLIRLDFNTDTTLSVVLEELQHWLEESDIDGFYFRNLDALSQTQQLALADELRAVKNPVMIIADEDRPELHYQIVDATMAIDFPAMLETSLFIENGMDTLDRWMQGEHDAYIESAYRVLYLSSPELNALEGTVPDRFGKLSRVATVLNATLHGMPMVYNGQASGNTRALSPYESDTIRYGDLSLRKLYSKLFQLKREESALRNGYGGGRYERLEMADDNGIFCFRRFNDESEVVVAVNLGDRPASLQLRKVPDATYASIFNSEVLSSFTNGAFDLPPHGYQVFVRTDKEIP